MLWSYLPLFFSVVLFLMSSYISALVQVWTDRNSPHWIPSLPDIGHRLLPYWTYFPINNYYLTTAIISVFVRYIVQPDIRLVVFRRYLFLQGVMLLMRSVSISVTSLSVPLPGCNTTAVGSPPLEAFYIMLSIHVTCGDVLFSGHAVTLTLCALAWTTYSNGEEQYPIRWLWNRFQGNKHEVMYGRSGWRYTKVDSTSDRSTCYITAFLVWLWTIIGYGFLIATRFHYTVDVFLGFLLAQLTWQTYHLYIKTLPIQRNRVIARFFIWFEGSQRVSDKTGVCLVIGRSDLNEEHLKTLSNIVHLGDVSYI